MGRPKALLELDGNTFIQLLIRDLEAAGISPVIVVLGHRPQELKPSIPEGVRVSINPDYRRGQLSSLKQGLKALADRQGNIEGPVLIALIDQPFAPLPVIAALREAVDSGAAAAIPCFEGRPGHPVMLSPELAATALAAGPQTTLADLLRPKAARVEVGDERILLNINTPKDYSKITEGGYP